MSISMSWDYSKFLFSIGDIEYKISGPLEMPTEVYEIIHINPRGWDRESLQALVTYCSNKETTSVTNITNNHTELSSKYNYVETLGEAQVAVGFDNVEELAQYVNNKTGTLNDL